MQVRINDIIIITFSSDFFSFFRRSARIQDDENRKMAEKIRQENLQNELELLKGEQAEGSPKPVSFIIKTIISF